MTPVSCVGVGQDGVGHLTADLEPPLPPPVRFEEPGVLDGDPGLGCQQDENLLIGARELRSSLLLGEVESPPPSTSCSTTANQLTRLSVGGMGDEPAARRRPDSPGERFGG